MLQRMTSTLIGGVRYCVTHEIEYLIAYRANAKWSSLAF